MTVTVVWLPPPLTVTVPVLVPAVVQASTETVMLVLAPAARLPVVGVAWIQDWSGLTVKLPVALPTFCSVNR